MKHKEKLRLTALKPSSEVALFENNLNFHILWMMAIVLVVRRLNNG